MGAVVEYFRQQNRLRRARRNYAKEQRTAAMWRQLIGRYYSGETPQYTIRPKRPDLVGQRIIWQYWAQGPEDRSQLPEVVRLSYASVDQHVSEGYRVIRLSDDTIGDYIDLPEVVQTVRQTNLAMTIAYFSDILRLALLSAYGGVWLDSTIFVAHPWDEQLEEGEFFMYQRDPEEPLRDYWQSHMPLSFSWRSGTHTNVQNAIIFAQPQSRVIGTLLDILILYWAEKEDEKLPEVYLFFHVLFDCLVRSEEGPLHDRNCPLRSDTNVEILQRMMRDDWPREYGSPSEILEHHPLQKLNFRAEHELYLRLIDLLTETDYLPRL